MWYIFLFSDDKTERFEATTVWRCSRSSRFYFAQHADNTLQSAERVVVLRAEAYNPENLLVEGMAYDYHHNAVVVGVARNTPLGLLLREGADEKTAVLEDSMSYSY